MTQRAYFLVSGSVFLLIAFGHLARLVLNVRVALERSLVPMWPSLLAVLLMGYLAFEGFRLARPSRGR